MPPPASSLKIWLGVVAISVVTLYFMTSNNKPKRKESCNKKDQQKKSKDGHPNNKEISNKKQESDQSIISRQTDEDILENMLNEYEQKEEKSDETGSNTPNNTAIHDVEQHRVSLDSDDKWYYRTKQLFLMQQPESNQFTLNQTTDQITNGDERVNDIDENEEDEEEEDTQNATMNIMTNEKINNIKQSEFPQNTESPSPQQIKVNRKKEEVISKLILINGLFRVFLSNYIVPLTVIELVAAFSNYADLLIVTKDETKKLESGHYIFDEVVIEEGGILTVNAWHSGKNQGGKLSVRALTKFVTEKGGKIDLDGKGYKGGRYDALQPRAGAQSWSGESYNTPSIKQYNNNLGGGGGGAQGYGMTYGGGGGYGTNGGSQFDVDGYCINGGIQYGDKWIKEMYLGSGGGACLYNNASGGHGGGALKIQCNVFQNNGVISVNGGNGGIDAGGGSGGSIAIECEQFIIMNDQHCFITAVGGKGGSNSDIDDVLNHGGFGRIRINISKTNSRKAFISSISNKQIIPTPFVSNKPFGHRSENITIDKKIKYLVCGYLHDEKQTDISVDVVIIICEFYQCQTAIYCIGYNNGGQFGVDHRSDSEPERKLIKMGWSKDKMIMNIRSGNDMAYYESLNGDWYVAGNKYELRELQCMQNKKQSEKTNIQLLNMGKIRIQKIFVSPLSHSGFVLSDNHNIYSYHHEGYVDYESALDIHHPFDLKYFDKCNVVDIQLTAYYSIFLMNDGSVHKTENTKNRTLHKIEGMQNIKEIKCGSSHCLLLDGDGRFFIFSESNKCGEMGMEIAEEEIEGNAGFHPLPRIIPFFQDKKIKIRKISCGSAHSVVLSEDHKVYCWGYNGANECGLDSEKPMISSPQIIQTLKNVDIVHIDCGSSHNLCTAKDGTIFMWGSNECGECFLNAEKKVVPIPMTGDFEEQYAKHLLQQKTTSIPIPTAINSILSETLDVSKIAQISLGNVNTKILLHSEHSEQYDIF